MPKLIPGIPRARKSWKSPTMRWRRDTSYMSDDENGSVAGQVLAHQQAVAGTRLVHEGRRRRAGAVEVEGDADGVGPGVVAQERPRSQQSLLLTVGEQEDDVVARRRARAQGARRLQEGGDAAAVVRRPDRGGHGVVVGHEQHGTRGVGAREAADHVVDHAGHARIDRRDDLGRLRVRVQAEALEMPPDVAGGGGAARRADRSRAPGDDAQVVHGAGRGELVG